jgi:hypothetical protein
LFKSIPAVKPVLAAVEAITELSHPPATPPNRPVSEWSKKTFAYLRDSCGGENSDLFSRFPHMRYILDAPEKVQAYLRQLWDELDDLKKEAYCGLDDLTQNIKWITGVAGPGKTNLLQVIILMAMFGEDGVEHRFKMVYFVNMNGQVSDFAGELNKRFADMGKPHRVIRLHGYETEIKHWKWTPTQSGPRRE